jgi:hypothetical protein
MTSKTPGPLVLVANNPFGHHLLTSQMLDPYRQIGLDRRILLLCNGVTVTADIDVFSFIEVTSFQRFGFAPMNFLYLLFKLVQLQLKSPDAVYHLRGFIVGFMFYLSRLFMLGRSKYIYDPRGAFFIEWKEAGGALCVSRGFRFVESRLIYHSLATIVTTERFADLYRRLFGQDHKYCVIYNSTSFALNPGKFLVLDGERIRLVYLGTFNHWHDLNEIHRVIESVTHQLGPERVEVDIFTPVKFHERVRKKFQSFACARFDVDYIEYQDIPSVLENKHIGISVVRPTLSASIASPIKISDYISLGLIPLLNTGIGDFDKVFAKENSAILYRFGKDIALPDLSSVRISENKATYELVSRSQSIKRLGQLVERLVHA